MSTATIHDTTVSQVQIPVTTGADSGVFVRRKKHDEAWDKFVESVYALQKLEDDWDGLGSKAPIPKVMDSAICSALSMRDGASIRVPARVLPTPQGTIVFEWHRGQTRVHAEIVEPHSIEWMLTSPGQEAIHWVE